MLVDPNEQGWDEYLVVTAGGDTPPLVRVSQFHP